MSAAPHSFRRLAASAMIVSLVLLSGCTLGGSAPTPSQLPTSTPILPTATPNLVVLTPKIIAAWLVPYGGGPCEGICSTLNFTATGPFDILVSCDGYQQFSGSLPTVDFQLFDANGHLADAFHHECGDPNRDVVTNFVIPERLPAGKYQLVLNDFPWETSITILDASH